MVKTKDEIMEACPHTHGDDPDVLVVAEALQILSPHAWG